MVLETERYPKDKTHRWRLVYQSNFTVRSGWEEYDSEGFRSFIRDGYLHIVVSVSNHWLFVNHEMILDNFRAQADIEMSSESGEAADCGLAFKSVGGNSDNAIFLFSAISRSGFYGLHRVGKGGYKGILDWKKSGFIKHGDKPNLLMFERVGTKVTVGINNYIVGTGTVRGLTRLTRGTVGLFARTHEDDVYAEAMFKNFLLYSVYRKKSRQMVGTVAR